MHRVNSLQSTGLCIFVCLLKPVSSACTNAQGQRLVYSITTAVHWIYVTVGSQEHSVDITYLSNIHDRHEEW